MGCKISKNENDIKSKADDHDNIDDIQQPDTSTTATMTEHVDYKSRLEWKMCLVSIFRFGEKVQKVKITINFRQKIHQSRTLIYPIAI